jgi:hypothetical protein
MRFACFVFAGALLAQAPQNPAPLYVESSIVNAASSKVEGLAPNTLATLYGRHLAWTTRALNADDVRGGVVPTALGGAGVRVLVNRVEAPLLFVSPGQVNFLVPSELTPGTAEVRLSLDGRYGPAVHVRLSEATPALFQWDPEFVVAVRADGSAVTHASPAKSSSCMRPALGRSGRSRNRDKSRAAPPAWRAYRSFASKSTVLNCHSKPFLTPARHRATRDCIRSTASCRTCCPIIPRSASTLPEPGARRARGSL